MRHTIILSPPPPPSPPLPPHTPVILPPHTPVILPSSEHSYNMQIFDSQWTVDDVIITLEHDTTRYII